VYFTDPSTLDTRKPRPLVTQDARRRLCALTLVYRTWS